MPLKRLTILDAAISFKAIPPQSSCSLSKSKVSEIHVASLVSCLNSTRYYTIYVINPAKRALASHMLNTYYTPAISFFSVMEGKAAT